MPIDYKKYPPNWKTEIRPAILKRAGNCCEQCNIPNYIVILRGHYAGSEVFQDQDGNIYYAHNSVAMGSDYVGEVDPTCKNNYIKIVLTIAHLNHDINDNREENLKALCQRCHNRHDINHRKQNRKKKQPTLF